MKNPIAKLATMGIALALTFVLVGCGGDIGPGGQTTTNPSVDPPNR